MHETLSDRPGERLDGRRWWLATGLVLAAALLATVPTTGDIGLTWDEPAYRYSQLVSIQWWERLAAAPARGWDEVRALFEPDALLYYWPYGRHGINFHPPLAGQLDLLTYVAVRALGQGHPGAAAGVGLRVCADDRAGVRVPGAAVRGVGRRGRGRGAAGDAAGLRRRPHRGDRHAGPAALGGDGPGVLEGPVRARRAALAGRGRGAPGAGLRREDGAPCSSSCRCWSGWSPSICRGRFAARGRGTGRLDRRRADDPGAAGTAGAGVRGDPPPGGQAPPAGPYEPVPGSSPRAGCRGRSWPSPAWSGSSAGCWRGSSRGTRSGGSSGRRWRPGRRSWRSPRWSAGWATRPGGARPCPGWPITTCSTPTGGGPCPTSGSSTSARPMCTASPGTTPGS